MDDKEKTVDETVQKAELIRKLAIMSKFCDCLTCGHLCNGMKAFHQRYACQRKHCVIDPFKKRKCPCKLPSQNSLLDQLKAPPKQNTTVLKNGQA